jgi:hypothetical protein
MNFANGPRIYTVLFCCAIVTNWHIAMRPSRSFAVVPVSDIRVSLVHAPFYTNRT